MRSFIICMQCQKEDGLPNPDSFVSAPIPDNGVIETTCPRGHRWFTIIQQLRFEILSELAVVAIVDGYHREAVASFAASLERLYEFYVEVACRRRGIGIEQLKTTWKPLARSSERQLGAFSLVYLLENGKPPKLLQDEWVSLRNRVVHQGRFPTREEAIAFGQAIADCATPILELLASGHYEDACWTAIGDYRQQRADALAPDTYNVSAIPTPFGLDREEIGPIDIAAIVDERAKRAPVNDIVWQSRELLRMYRDSELQKSTTS